MTIRKDLLAWIKEYEAKTGDTFSFLPGFTTWYLPDRGFCQWKPMEEEKTILCWNLCHDAKFWRDSGVIHWNAWPCNLAMSAS